MGVEAAVVRRTLLDMYDGPCEHYDSHKLAYGLDALDRLLQRLEKLEKALQQIATATWNPAIGLPGLPNSELHSIARAAITQEEERK